MDWSLRTLISLAENVRKYPILYDRHKTLQDPIRKKRAWGNVAEAVGKEESSCIRRWQVLRNRYITSIGRGCRVRPVGIEPYLKFLTPFLRFKVKSHAQCSPESTLEYCTKLTQIVKDYPTLYFHNRKRTGKSDVWQKVAIRMGTGGTPEQIRFHWSRLRIRYCFHLKKGFKMKPSGIEQHMAFLNPLIAAREKASLGKPKIKINKEQEDMNAKLRRDSAVAAILSHKHLRLNGEDEDTQFLFEFLQDMAKMSDAEKMSFKLNALKLVEKLKYEKLVHDVKKVNLVNNL